MNYKSTSDYDAALRELLPAGVNVYFDNVGGPITDAVFAHLAVGARVGICGQILVHSATKPPQGPRLFWHLIVKRATVRGLLALDFADRFHEALRPLAEWVTTGRLRYRERVSEGLENAPRAFMELLQGQNIGKQLVRISDV